MNYYKIKIMTQVNTKNYIRVSKKEYLKLKELQEHFEVFWQYFSHLQDIKEAREDIKTGRVISQEQLFKKLGL